MILSATVLSSTDGRLLAVIGQRIVEHLEGGPAVAGGCRPASTRRRVDPWRRGELPASPSVAVVPPISGPLMSSLLWLWLTMEAVTIALVVVFSFIIPGVFVADSVIGMAIGISIFVPFFQRISSVSVDDAGFEIRSPSWVLVVQWEDILAIQAGKFSGKAVLRAPVRMGLVTRGKIAFAAFDPEWRTRPVSAAILEAAGSRGKPVSF